MSVDVNLQDTQNRLCGSVAEFSCNMYENGGLRTPCDPLSMLSNGRGRPPME